MRVTKPFYLRKENDQTLCYLLCHLKNYVIHTIMVIHRWLNTLLTFEGGDLAVQIIRVCRLTILFNKYECEHYIFGRMHNL